MSPSYFVTLISNSKTREIFGFKNEVDDDNVFEFSEEDFTSLNDCIDQSRQTETFSIASLIGGQSPKRQKTEDSQHVVFVCFNTSLGKAKPVNRLQH